jgi:hypothetical protein
MARRTARGITWVTVALALSGLGMAVGGCGSPTAADPSMSPSPEPDPLARMASTLDCHLADNATLDPIVFTGDSQEQSIDALEAEVDVRAERWTGALPRIPMDAMTDESAWLVYDPDGGGHGIITAGLSQRPESPRSGQWVAYLTDVCEGALSVPTSTQP